MKLKKKKKKTDFTAIRLLFLRDVKSLVSNKNYFGERNYKFFIGYFYSGNKVKKSNIMLPKTSTYVKRYDGQTKWMYFLIEHVD